MLFNIDFNLTPLFAHFHLTTDVDVVLCNTNVHSQWPRKDRLILSSQWWSICGDNSIHWFQIASQGGFLPVLYLMQVISYVAGMVFISIENPALFTHPSTIRFYDSRCRLGKHYIWQMARDWICQVATM